MPVPGNLFVIAAPSGTGKTTLVKALVDTLPQITVSISHTTRSKRPAEINSINYYFISKDEFHDMIEKKAFLEYANVFNHYYGTSQEWVRNTLSQGLDVILEIDWQGCQQIKQFAPDCISIFILPPSVNDLANRLKNRNQDKPQIIEQRLTDAKETVQHVREFDYVIINADFEHALNDLKTIIKAARLAKKQQMIRYEQLITEFV